MIYDENGFVKVHKPSKKEIKKESRKFWRRMFWQVDFPCFMMSISPILWALAIIIFAISIIINVCY